MSAKSRVLFKSVVISQFLSGIAALFVMTGTHGEEGSRHVSDVGRLADANIVITVSFE